jgi:regulator of RNase E activity RraA
MYTVKPLPEAIPNALLQRLLLAQPATIGHTLHEGFMDTGITTYFESARVVGTAITVQAPNLDGAIVHYAIGQSRPGDVLVVDRCGDNRHACIGGAMAYAARAAGLAGIIVDGPVTDLLELREYGVPVWSRGLSPITCKTLGIGGSFCLPVSCGGVSVAPGDAIFADVNGILVLRKEQIEMAVDRAIYLQEAEKVTLARMDKGEKYPDILGSTAVVMSKLNS